MSDPVAIKREPLNVAASIIADVSAGIYRTPAGALKELISNAFDADAEAVHISTGAPTFKTFTCTDDGRGITPDEFRSIMSRIGGSSKRDQSETTPRFKRPFVGRIGIGLLSVAQICRRFVIISSKKGVPKKFRAEIDLDPYMLAEARRANLGVSLSDEIQIGFYTIQETEEEEDSQYTRIVMDKIDEGFRQRLTDAVQKRGGFNVKRFMAGTMSDFLNSIGLGPVAEHGAYAQMVWELAATSPVPYLDDAEALAGSSDLSAIIKCLRNYKFAAFLDGVELRKPVRLPPPESASITNRLYPLKHTATVAGGRKVSLVGYLYWQRSRITPRELQGVLVRVRNVAIGAYDPTYLGYPHHEGFKFSQLSGELYVDSGLDEAVNIDRASFRESDPGFIEVQGFLFEKLRGGTDEGAGIFSQIKREVGQARKASKSREERHQAKSIAKAIGSGIESFTVQRSAASADVESGVRIRADAVELDGILLQTVSRRHQRLFAAICGLLEAALRRSLPPAKRKELYERLAKVLDEF